MQNKVLYFHISFDMQTKYKNALHDKNKSYMRGVWVDDAYWWYTGMTYANNDLYEYFIYFNE